MVTALSFIVDFQCYEFRLHWRFLIVDLLVSPKTLDIETTPNLNFPYTDRKRSLPS